MRLVRPRLALVIVAVSLSLGAHDRALAQADDDTRTQFPVLLRNSFFAIHLGAVDQPFSQDQLAPGFHATGIDVPPVAARAVLFGHEFNRHLLAQASYLRPVQYVTYTDVQGAGPGSSHVRVNFGSVTLGVRAPIGGRLSLTAESGLGITSRTGFKAGGIAVVEDAHYASVVFGGGVAYRLSPAWDLSGALTYFPGKASVDQPRTLFASAGFRYTIRPLPDERVEASRRSGYVFPEHVVQAEYSSGVGYGVNNFVSRTVPVFWGGHARVDSGVAFHYQQNVFHTSKLFALDVGASVGSYRTQRDRDRFVTVSVYPLLRLTFLRTRPADLYVGYSLVGPTYISKTTLDGLDTGAHFTFQDFLGVGIFAGRNRNLTLGVKINHYSNGNIFTQNAGVKIPLTFSAGYTF